MENFSSLMFVINMNSSKLETESSKVDIIGCLPTEVATSILRLVDGPSLAAAAAVSQRWQALCRADRRLRRCLRRQHEREARGGLHALREIQRPVARSAPLRAFARLDTQRVRAIGEGVHPAGREEFVSRVAVEKRRPVPRAVLGVFPKRLQRDHSAQLRKWCHLVSPGTSGGMRKMMRQ